MAMHDRDRITGLIEATATQDHAALAAALVDGCWPGGGDRRNRVASEWLRRWRPQGMTAAAAECGCASGRCDWCN